MTAGGQTLFTDGAESGANGWTSKGFTAVGASQSKAYDNFYIAANRTYVSYDQYLKTGPYNFGFTPQRPDFVEHYAYQQGVLLSYWDTSAPIRRQRGQTGTTVTIRSPPSASGVQRASPQKGPKASAEKTAYHLPRFGRTRKW